MPTICSVKIVYGLFRLAVGANYSRGYYATTLTTFSSIRIICNFRFWDLDCNTFLIDTIASDFIHFAKITKIPLLCLIQISEHQSCRPCLFSTQYIYASYNFVTPY